MRLTVVQYAGDYLEAYERFRRGGKSTYHAQRYSVEFDASLAQRFEQVAVLCAVCPEPYDIVLPNKVRAVGAGLKPGFHAQKLLPLIARTQPDHLVLTTPMVPVLRWARRNGVQTITALADSFGTGGLVTGFRNYLLARELNHSNVEWVGNHGISACLSLLNIGVCADKLIPWDWPRMHRPYDYAPRKLNRGEKFKIAYVGSLSHAKGLGDLLRALRSMENVALTIIGKRNPEFDALANGLDVRFAGVVWNEEIPAEMRKVDAIVVPSRHDYPEGLPGTIYQALASRTPIVASDHPMFRGAVIHEESALIFAAGDEKALAASIRRLAADPELYSKLSENSIAAWEALQLPVIRGEFIEKWLGNGATNAEWLYQRRLLSGLYQKHIEARLPSATNSAVHEQSFNRLIWNMRKIRRFRMADVLRPETELAAGTRV